MRRSRSVAIMLLSCFSGPDPGDSGPSNSETSLILFFLRLIVLQDRSHLLRRELGRGRGAVAGVPRLEGVAGGLILIVAPGRHLLGVVLVRYQRGEALDEP